MNRVRPTKTALIFAIACCGSLLVFGFNNCQRMMGPIPESSVPSQKGVETGNPMSGPVALPKVFIDSSFPQLRNDRKILTVGKKGRNFTDCQSAVNAASPGDEVVIDAGYVCMHLVLPDKGDSSDYVVIRSSDVTALPPEGQRLSREDAAHLAIIETRNYEFAVGVEDVPSGSRAVISPNHYYLLGLEMRVSAKSTQKNGYIVKLRKEASSLADMPHDIVIARSWIHGNPGQEVRTGIDMNGLRISVVDSIIEDVHLHNETSEAIAAWDAAAGPYKITNNEFAVAGVGLLLGWQSSVSGLIPSDIEVRGNYFHKLDTWRQPVTGNTGLSGHWFFGNPIVLRSAQRVLFDGNTIANDWAQIPEGSNYMGHAFWIVPNGFDQPWARVQDITITNNVLHDVGGGFGILYQDPSLPEVIVQRVLIENNVAYNLDPKNRAGFIYLGGEAKGAVTFNHNTFLSRENSSPAMIVAEEKGVFDQLTFTNNIFYDTGAGILGATSQTRGSQALTTQFPNVLLRNNVFAGQDAAAYAGYTATNFFPADLVSVGFTANPATAGNDYRSLMLTPSSPYYRAGADGTDIGADVMKIRNAVLGYR